MMTERRGRLNQQTGKLKGLLLTGSILATLAGMQLLPRQEAAAVAAPAPVTIVVPAEGVSSTSLRPGERKTQLELPPIPQAVQPQINPVARTRSSR